MVDPVVLKEALAEWDSWRRMTEQRHPKADELEDMRVPTILADAAREYLTFLEGPTDEDVEAAAKALDYECPDYSESLALAALVLVAEARRGR